MLIKIKEPEEKTPGGILMPKTILARSQIGEVVASGEGKSIGKHKLETSVKVISFSLSVVF